MKLCWFVLENSAHSFFFFSPQILLSCGNICQEWPTFLVSLFFKVCQLWGICNNAWNPNDLIKVLTYITVQCRLMSLEVGGVSRGAGWRGTSALFSPQGPRLFHVVALPFLSTQEHSTGSSACDRQTIEYVKDPAGSVLGPRLGAQVECWPGTLIPFHLRLSVGLFGPLHGMAAILHEQMFKK